MSRPARVAASRAAASRVAATRALPVLVALLAIVATACGGPATPALSDPKQILEAGISGLQEARTFHLEGTADGKVVLSLGGTPGTGSGVPITLDGSTLTGDADLAGKRASLSVVIPALFNLTADVVAVDGVVYARLPLPGSGGWTRQAGSGSIFDTLADPAKLLDEFAAFLDRPEVAPRKLSNERCSDADCYAVSFTIPAALLGAGARPSGASPAGGSPSGSSPAVALPGGLVLGDIAVTALVRTDTPLLVESSFDVPLGAGGTVNLALELSKFGDPVTIVPPPGG